MKYFIKLYLIVFGFVMIKSFCAMALESVQNTKCTAQIFANQVHRQCVSLNCIENYLKLDQVLSNFRLHDSMFPINEYKNEQWQCRQRLDDSSNSACYHCWENPLYYGKNQESQPAARGGTEKNPSSVDTPKVYMNKYPLSSRMRNQRPLQDGIIQYDEVDPPLVNTPSDFAKQPRPIFVTPGAR